MTPGGWLDRLIDRAYSEDRGSGVELLKLSALFVVVVSLVLGILYYLIFRVVGELP